MKKTENLKLNILEGSDPISVEGFNENANLLDALCGRMAMLETGSYDGDNTYNREITFSKKPALVLIICNSCTALCFQGCETAMVLTDGYSWANKRISVSWNNNSLDLGTATAYLNAQDTQYHYVAFLTP